jgi:hypothetical protein
VLRDRRDHGWGQWEWPFRVLYEGGYFPHVIPPYEWMRNWEYRRGLSGKGTREFYWGRFPTPREAWPGPVTFDTLQSPGDAFIGTKTRHLRSCTQRAPS